MRTRGHEDTRPRGPEPEPGDSVRRSRERGAEMDGPRAPPLPKGGASDPCCAPWPSPGPSRRLPEPRLLPELGWNLSLAGCGFRALYHLGALSCLLEHEPELVLRAARFSGASSGSLVAAALAVNVPLSLLASELVSIAMEARLLSVGVFHPSFSLLRRTRDSLLKLLPLDAHEHASRRLCVSLTRVHDGKNLRVTHFRSREELVQVLLCSCFFPVYCGFIPPTYKGESFMDGALSDNQPLSELQTLSFSPFSGESDICPKETGFSPIQVCFGNVSIEVNTGNVYRVWTSFLPQSPEVLLHTCVGGYTDALRFISRSGAARRSSWKRNICRGTEERNICRGTEERNICRGTEERNICRGTEERNICRGTEESQILPPEIRRVLVSACYESDPRTPEHFSAPPLLSVVLGLVLDLVLVLIRLVLLPFGLLLKLSFRRLTLSCSVRTETSRPEKSPDPEHLITLVSDPYF
ncbi:patatin-like phospholipase domain-containing protein 4 isoform X1 [Eucyclogobius newberryi]|uniref:patatin-like phospholipase domain-containing protein 4 isoform X1 n=1 Tax=Eucyclogobius newberryi TaxID=166745 RepID=UPI003B5C16F8